MTNERKCVSCGAPIPYGARRCEYCGMEYEPDYWAGTLRYVPLHMGRKPLRARSEIDDFIADHVDKDTVASHVRYDLAHQLADGIAEMMSVRMQYDPMRRVTIVQGEVWVEEPDKRTAFESW